MRFVSGFAQIVAVFYSEVLKMQPTVYGRERYSPPPQHRTVHGRRRGRGRTEARAGRERGGEREH